MDHHDHVELLQGNPGVRERLNCPIRADGNQPVVWADLGSGGGAFTLALADLLGPGAVIYSVDRDRSSLRDQEVAMRRLFPGTVLHLLPADFTRPLDLPPLNGIVMANSLHFISNAEKPGLLKRLRGLIQPAGQLILVEYNVDRGNMWVPHPLSYPTWEKLAKDCGFPTTNRLAVKPSRFLGEIYSALSVPQVP